MAKVILEWRTSRIRIAVFNSEFLSRSVRADRIIPRSTAIDTRDGTIVRQGETVAAFQCNIIAARASPRNRLKVNRVVRAQSVALMARIRCLALSPLFQPEPSVLINVPADVS